MAENLILSNEDKVLLDFGESLKSFVSEYGRINSEYSNGIFQLTFSIQREWVKLIESITKCKHGLSGPIRIKNEDAFKIIYDFLIKEDSIANDEIYCESIDCLEYKLNDLYDNGVINIEKSDTYSIASEIVSCYFHPIVTSDEKYLYYTNGDISNIAWILSNELDISLNDILILPSIFIPKVMSFEEKYRLLKLFSTIGHINKKDKINNIDTYIGTDSSGMYKIGKTSNLINREKSIMTGNHSYKTIILIKGDFENELHKFFRDKNVSGEWFTLSDIDLNYIISNYDIIFNRIGLSNVND